MERAVRKKDEKEEEMKYSVTVNLKCNVLVEAESTDQAELLAIGRIENLREETKGIMTPKEYSIGQIVGVKEKKEEDDG